MTYTAHVDTFARDHLPPREQWPDLIFELPELKYPERVNCAVELLDRNVVNGHGARVAIIGADGVAGADGEVLDRGNQIGVGTALPGIARAVVAAFKRAVPPGDTKPAVPGVENHLPHRKFGPGAIRHF